MLSIFDVTGPVMIGPSSSHTAGAARLARVARALFSGTFHHVSFGLHGSFHDTFRGHGTDKALLAGALNIHEDDEALRDAPALAKRAGITYDYHRVDLHDAHENSVEITFHLANKKTFTVVGSSIGGGQIVITRIGNLEMEFTALLPTLIIEHLDRRGMFSEITQTLSEAEINIGAMRTSRTARGGYACCLVETDDEIPGEVVAKVAALHDVYSAKAVNIKS